MKIGLAILNRNEAEALPTILPAIPRDAVDLLFAIDGGSTDGSRELLSASGIHVLSQPAPGRGEAFRLAFAHARDRVDALVFFSADGNEDPRDIPKFRAPLERGVDLVIASRMMTGAHNEEDDQLFKARKWANQAFSRVAHLTWGRGQPYITDPINGFRAITVRAWDHLSPDGDGYTIEYQTSIRAYRTHSAVFEFPTHEGARLGGVSQAKSVPTGLRFVALYLRELRRPPPAAHVAPRQ